MTTDSSTAAFAPATGFINGNALPWEPMADGVRRRILGYDDHLMMMMVEFRKGSIGVVHKHPHRQVSSIVKGSFEVEIGGAKKVLRAGDGFFIPPDVLHGVVALEEGMLVDVFTPCRDDILAVRSK